MIRKDSEHLLEACRNVLRQYGGAITVRQAYYRLVAALVIPNTLASYKRLVAHLTKWRKDGEIDPHAFTDLTRQPEITHGWSSLASFLDAVRYSYRYDLWYGQAIKPELWLEKQALATIFIPIAKCLQVILQVCRGYPSISTLVDAVDRGVQEIIYYGDWDPSGIDIDRSIRDEMHHTWGHKLAVKRVALLPQQIEQHKLPPVPPKTTDSRTLGFVLAHGSDTVELDALPPDVLRKMVTASVMEYVDDSDAWETAKKKEQEDQNELGKYIDSLLKKRT